MVENSSVKYNTRDGNGAQPVGNNKLSVRERALWLGLRQALLAAVGVIEKYLEMERTAEMRRQNR